MSQEKFSEVTEEWNLALEDGGQEGGLMKERIVGRFSQQGSWASPTEGFQPLRRCEENWRNVRTVAGIQADFKSGDEVTGCREGKQTVPKRERKDACFLWSENY